MQKLSRWALEYPTHLFIFCKFAFDVSSYNNVYNILLYKFALRLINFEILINKNIIILALIIHINFIIFLLLTMETPISKRTFLLSNYNINIKHFTLPNYYIYIDLAGIPEYRFITFTTLINKAVHLLYEYLYKYLI